PLVASTAPAGPLAATGRCREGISPGPCPSPEGSKCLCQHKEPAAPRASFAGDHARRQRQVTPRALISRSSERGRVMADSLTKSAARNVLYGGSLFFFVIFVGLTAHSHYFMVNV